MTSVVTGTNAVDVLGDVSTAGNAGDMTASGTVVMIGAAQK